MGVIVTEPVPNGGSVTKDSNVVEFTGETIIPIPCERVLEAAKGYELSSVLVIGRHPDGTLYLAASHSEMGEILLLLERAKLKFLAMAEPG